MLIPRCLGLTKAFVVFSFLSVFFTSFSFGNHDHKKADAEFENICSSLLSETDSAKLFESIDLRHQAKSEHHSLLDLIHPDPEKNLAVKNPWIVLNTPQTLDDLIESFGYIEIPEPVTGIGTVRLPKLFYEGGPLTNYNVIVENYEAGLAVVRQIKAASHKTASARYVILLEGPPGTGKSKFLSIFEHGLKNVSLQNPEQFSYSYYWTGLEKIPSLRANLPSQEELKEQGGHVHHCSANHSPLVLLPKTVQEQVIAWAIPNATKRIGVTPSPLRSLCPVCNKFRDKILEHYKNTEFGGQPLAAMDQVKVLNRHVGIKRLILGDPGTIVLLPAQSKSTDLKSLFVSINPVVYFNSANELDPESFKYDGPLITAKVVLEDEILKSPRDYTNKRLNTIQDAKFSDGGAPTIELDQFNMMATNSDDIKEHLEAEPNSPFMSRVIPVPMKHLIRPDSISKALVSDLSTTSLGLFIKKLGNPNSEYENIRGKLNEVFPFRPLTEKAQFPTGRYDMRIGQGKNSVHFSPYFWEYVSSIFSLNRQNFDPAAFEKHGNLATFPILLSNPNAYASPVVRLNKLLGLDPMSPREAQEMHDASKLLKEGIKGLDHRKITVLIDDAISQGRLPKNGHCVTPMLFQKVLESRFLDPNFIKDDSERKQLKQFAKLVAHEFLLGKLQADFQSALIADDRDVDMLYQKLLRQLIALNGSVDPADEAEKVEYHDAEGSIRQITKKDRQNINEIMEIYFASNKRQFKPRELKNFLKEITNFLSASMLANKQDQPHEQLRSAVAMYLRKRVLAANETVFEKVRLAMTSPEQATVEDKELAYKISQTLIHKYGYCAHCFGEARDIINNPPDAPTQE